MRTRFLFLSLASSAIACTAPPDTVQVRPHINTRLQPGEAGTLVELGDDRHWLREIVLTENYLFFAVAWGGIYRMPKYGGDVVAVDEDARSDFYHLATDGRRVYWDHPTYDSRDYPYEEIRSQPVDGGPTATLAAGDFGIFRSSQFDSLQVAGGDVYFTSSPAGVDYGSIERVPVGGGARETLLPVTDIFATPAWIADGDAGIYFTTAWPATPTGGTASDCSVEHLSTAGQAPEVLGFCPTADSYAIGSDADVIYLYSSVGIWRWSKRDGSASRIEPDYPDVGRAVTFDASNIYTLGGSRTPDRPPQIVSFPKTGGTVTPIADVNGCLIGVVGAMAVDAQYLYLVCGMNQERIDVFPLSATP